MHRAAAAAALVTTLGGGYGQAWSPGGAVGYIAPAPREYVAANGVLTEAPGLNRVVVRGRVVAVAPPGETLAEVRFAAGGRVVYADTNYTLWSALPGRRPLRLGTLGVTGGAPFSISRDGREVAPGLRVDGVVPQWSPDGRSIAFTATGGGGDRDVRVYRIGADGRGLHRIP